MNATKSLVCVVFSLTLVSFAFAEGKVSLQQRKNMKKADEKLAETLKNTNDKCGSKLSFSIDWPSFAGHFSGSVTEGSAAAYCGSVLDGVASVCADEAGKEAVTKQLKEVKCSHKAGLKNVQGQIKDGALLATLSFDSGNISSEMKTWLMNNLQ